MMQREIDSQESRWRRKQIQHYAIRSSVLHLESRCLICVKSKNSLRTLLSCARILLATLVGCRPTKCICVKKKEYLNDYSPSLAALEELCLFEGILISLKVILCSFSSSQST